MDLGDRIDRDFSYHSPAEDSIWKMKAIRDHAKVLAYLISSYVPSGREQSLAITKLEEVSMWANAGIARNQPEVPLEERQLTLFPDPITKKSCGGNCKKSCSNA